MRKNSLIFLLRCLLTMGAQAVDQSPLIYV